MTASTIIERPVYYNRGNAFLGRTLQHSVLRVEGTEYRIPDEAMPFGSLRDALSALRTPLPPEDLADAGIDPRSMALLRRTGAIGFGVVPDRLPHLTPYLLRNYDEPATLSARLSASGLSTIGGEFLDPHVLASRTAFFLGDEPHTQGEDLLEIVVVTGPRTRDALRTASPDPANPLSCRILIAPTWRDPGEILISRCKSPDQLDTVVSLLPQGNEPEAWTAANALVHRPHLQGLVLTYGFLLYIDQLADAGRLPTGYTVGADLTITGAEPIHPLDPERPLEPLVLDEQALRQIPQGHAVSDRLMLLGSSSLDLRLDFEAVGGAQPVRLSLRTPTARIDSRALGTDLGDSIREALRSALTSLLTPDRGLAVLLGRDEVAPWIGRPNLPHASLNRAGVYMVVTA